MPILAFILYFLTLGLSVFESAIQSSTQVHPDASDWQVLFNGKDLKGWVPKIHHHEVGDNYAETFRVQDGAIAVNYDGYGEFDDRFGHLFYEALLELSLGLGIPIHRAVCAHCTQLHLPQFRSHVSFAGSRKHLERTGLADFGGIPDAC